MLGMEPTCKGCAVLGMISLAQLGSFLGKAALVHVTNVSLCDLSENFPGIVVGCSRGTGRGGTHPLILSAAVELLPGGLSLFPLQL